MDFQCLPLGRSFSEQRISQIYLLKEINEKLERQVAAGVEEKEIKIGHEGNKMIQTKTRNDHGGKMLHTRKCLSVDWQDRDRRGENRKTL